MTMDVELDSALQPSRFQLQLDQAIATGQFVSPTHLIADIQQVPLEAIARLKTVLPLPEGIDRLSGQLSGTLSANLETVTNPAITAAFAIDQPRLAVSPGTPFSDVMNSSRHKRDRLIGHLHHGDGQTSIEQGEFRFGDSRGQFKAQIRPSSSDTSSSATPSVDAELTVTEGDIQDVATLLQTTYTSPVTPQPEAIASAKSTREITNTSSEFPTAMPQAALNQLAKLQGVFSSTLNLKTSPQQPLSAQLSLEGRHWLLNNIGIQHISLSNASLPISQPNLTGISLDTLIMHGITYQGQKGERYSLDARLHLSRSALGDWKGTVRASDISLGQLTRAVGNSVDISGDMDIDLEVSGQDFLPTLTGNVGMEDVCLSLFDFDTIDLNLHHQQGVITVDDGSSAYLFRQTLSELFGERDEYLSQDFEAFSNKSFIPKTNQLDQTGDRSHSPSHNKKVVIHYGLFNASFTLNDLILLTKTGHMPSAWKLYLRLAGMERTQLHQVLTQTVDVDVLMTDRILRWSPKTGQVAKL